MAKKEIEKKLYEITELHPLDERKKNEKCPFAKMFKRHCGALDKEDFTKVKTRDVAEQLGYEYETFRKIVNLNRPTYNRDLILAICVVLKLNCTQTDKMLRAYNHMPALDKDNPREQLLSQILNYPFRQKLSLNQVNKKLMQHGFQKLAIGDKNKQSELQNHSPYKCLKMRVQWESSCDYSGKDPYNSIFSRYQPSQYAIVAEMLIEHSESHKRLILSSSPYGSYRIYDPDDGFPGLKPVDSLSETDDLFCFFDELRVLAYKEFTKKLSYLDDTKYYPNGRSSAKIVNQSLYVYYEEYNFTIPELNEYLFMEYVNGNYTLNVYPDSIFLQKHLGSDEYKSYFQKSSPKAKETYTSVDQIEEYYSMRNQLDSQDLCHMRQSQYRRLKKRVIKLIQDIRCGKDHIRNVDYIYGIPDEVLIYYDITELFQCTYDEEFGEINGRANEVEWQMGDGQKFKLEFEDVLKGFDLGIDSIDEICLIKQKYGDVLDVVPKL